MSTNLDPFYRFPFISLPILINNVPEKGAKSRVETQIKMDLDLVLPPKDGSTSNQRVCSWKWLRLCRGSVTKKRPKKDAKQGKPHFCVIKPDVVPCPRH